jgi:hypothetical protein
VGGVGADARKPQQFEQAIQALRELLIYFCKNCFGMYQDFTSGLSRANNVTAAALAARAAA